MIDEIAAADMMRRVMQARAALRTSSSYCAQGTNGEWTMYHQVYRGDFGITVSCSRGLRIALQRQLAAEGIAFIVGGHRPRRFLHIRAL